MKPGDADGRVGSKKGGRHFRTETGREAEHMAEELKDRLLETNQEYRELVSKHHSLDDQLQKLEAKQYLSDTEQLEEVTLKKHKLQLKDRMESLLREHRQGTDATSVSA